MNETNPMDKMKEQFKSELKEQFNEAKFDEDMKSGKVISLENLDEYRKKEKNKFFEKKKKKDPNQNHMSNNRGLSFKGSFKNGEFIAIGSNGHIIKSKNIDDFHRQLAQVFKLNALKNREEPECTLHIGENVKNKKMWAESFARNFINAGITIRGDLPQSPEFWNKMKADYLAQKGHNLETWNKLTHFVPKEYMQSKENLSQYQTGIKQKVATQPKTISPFVMNKARGTR